MKRFLPVFLIFLLALPLTAGTLPGDLTLDTLIARGDMPTGAGEEGMDSLVGVRHAGDGSGRLFLIDQDGQIYIWNGISVLNTPFLDIRGPVDDAQNEEGLLGLAFHPDYDTNGYFFVNYTTTTSRTRIERYTVSAGDPNVADLATATSILEFAQPDWNHNGGDIHFGPDGYLYIGVGDGGGSGDPGNNGQDLGELLGTILRIDVDSTPGGTDRCGLVLNYAIPPDNPFIGGSGDCDEIWTWGLRNPWRWSFDRTTGDMLIGDVGQGAWEEVDFQPAASSGGTNWGWDCREGAHDYGGSQAPSCPNPPMEDPILEYSHGGSPFRCSITGGYRYRGGIGSFQGFYVYADYCADAIYFGEETSPGVWSSSTWSTTAASSITSFGEDEAGELYVTERNGDVLRFNAPPPDEVFSDGFESGDTTAWSSASP